MKNLLKSLAKKTAERAASAIGGQLISTRSYATLSSQRLALLQQAAALYRPTLGGKGAVGIVFSFNRPVQLQALLASYYLHAKQPSPLIVQYRASNADAERVYAEVASQFKGHEIKFVREERCRDTLLEILAQVRQPKLFFLVDDDIFIRDVNMAEFTAINPLEYVPSLRLAPHLNYSYTMKMPQQPPLLEKSKKYGDMLTWAWGSAGNEWNYPFSVEGHLFDTAEIVMMTRASAFKAPNTYEGVLAGFSEVTASRPGLCYAAARLFNIPCNKVQTENVNHAGETFSVTPEEFLNRWNSGEQIDVNAFTNFTPTSPHQEVAFSFIPRATGKTAAKPAPKAPATAKSPAKPRKKAA